MKKKNNNTRCRPNSSASLLFFSSPLALYLFRISRNDLNSRCTSLFFTSSRSRFLCIAGPILNGQLRQRQTLIETGDGCTCLSSLLAHLPCAAFIVLTSCSATHAIIY